MGMEDLEASLQTLQATGARVTYLTDRLRMTVAQITHRAAVQYRTGDLTAEDLCDVYDALRDAAGEHQGWTKPWKDEGLPDIRTLRRQIRKAKGQDGAPGPEGYWEGENPHSGTAYPPRWCAVVYVLYDTGGQPVYLGSTHHFANRVRAHRQDKQFSRWRAWPCRDREDAYRREEEMLRGHLPPLNRKAAR
jgi:hypothetical protein